MPAPSSTQCRPLGQSHCQATMGVQPSPATVGVQPSPATKVYSPHRPPGAVAPPCCRLPCTAPPRPAYAGGGG
eukprot:11864910-Alexandrium_andersonii.AAC.1